MCVYVSVLLLVFITVIHDKMAFCRGVVCQVTLFFEVEVSLHALIPLFMPGSVRGGSVDGELQVTTCRRCVE